MDSTKFWLMSESRVLFMKILQWWKRLRLLLSKKLRGVAQVEQGEKVWYYNATYRLEMQAKPLEKVTLKVKHLSCYWQIGSMQLCCLVRPTFIFLIVSNVICIKGDITKKIGVLKTHK